VRATITGIPAVPNGNTWTDGWIEFAFDAAWSDGSARSVSPVRGVLQPSTRDRFVTPGSLSPLLVPATPTGTGVVAGPRITMNWYLKDSSGNEFYDSVDCGILLADASNNWNMNTQLLPIQFVDNAGPAPVGLSQAQGDARYVQLGVLATTAAVGAMQFATGVEAAARTVAQKAVTPLALESIFGSALRGLLGADTTAGTLDWNHSSNARAGCGVTLLAGTATNGPGTASFFHSLCFEYQTKDGSGNLTQFAIPYQLTATFLIYVRTRFVGVWSAWRTIPTT
jgi:hypothetical protein